MIEPDNVPCVDDEELLARFVVAGQSPKSLRKHVRENGTPKSQLFLPYKHIELSVNRHRDCDEVEVWSFGQAVAEARRKTLHGRCDIKAADCRLDSLKVVAKPIAGDSHGDPGNPNHADIVGFPVKKEDQLSLAAKLAAMATDLISPT